MCFLSGEEDAKFEDLHLAVFEDATTIESGVCESLTMWTCRREEGLEGAEYERLNSASMRMQRQIKSGVCESLTMWTSRREEGLEDVKFEELHLAVEEDATTIETVYETAFVK